MTKEKVNGITYMIYNLYKRIIYYLSWDGLSEEEKYQSSVHEIGIKRNVLRENLYKE